MEFRKSSSGTFFPPSDRYSDAEKQKLKEFREKVSEILTKEEYKEDSYLIRWLRARNLDLGKAEEMLRNHLKWRKEKDIDTIIDRVQVPEDMMNAAPIAFCGISEEGYGILLAPFGRHDPRAALEKYGLEACEEFNVVIMEQFDARFKEESKKFGRPITQVLEIMDCEGYSYRQMASKVCRDFMIRMQKQMDSHYPELLRYAMMVNTPKVFTLLFAMLKPFIPKATLEKIDVYGPDVDKWKAVVRERFPIDKIPPHWGGTLEGVDEFCSGHEIWIQGPKDLRSYMHGLAEADADFHKTVVNARDKFTKEVDVLEKGTILEWKFKTDNHDIAFQLTMSPKNEGGLANGNGTATANGKDVEIVPYARVDAHSAVQEGSHVCEVPGHYSFVFDNSFSMMKAKTLLYQIGVIDLQHQEHPENFEDCPEI